MKTFKLNELQIVNYETETYEKKGIPLLDGLIINREEEDNQWLIEAYTDYEFLDFFRDYKEKYEELIIHVRITTESNELATCVTSIIELNEIGENMNVLLLGTMVDKRTAVLETILEELIEEGNRGESLLSAFKENL